MFLLSLRSCSPIAQSMRFHSHRTLEESYFVSQQFELLRTLFRNSEYAKALSMKAPQRIHTGKATHPHPVIVMLYSYQHQRPYRYKFLLPPPNHTWKRHEERQKKKKHHQQSLTPSSLHVVFYRRKKKKSKQKAKALVCRSKHPDSPTEKKHTPSTNTPTSRPFKREQLTLQRHARAEIALEAEKGMRDEKR